TNVALFINFFLFLELRAILTKKCYNINFHTSIINDNNNNLLISNSNISNSLLDRSFIEWFVGFTDAEGNFNIKLTDLNNNTFKYVQFTFQIDLHKDDIKVLEYIRDNLKCGHISKSRDKVNFFINDQNSLLNVIIPLFDEVNLNSSKYHYFVLFKKAVMLIKNKEHLTDEGKLAIINYKKEMQSMSGKWVPESIYNKINITKYWLAGFIDGEGSFSTNKYVPRFKLENHIKESELYHKIKEFMGTDKLIYSSDRSDKRVESNPTIILEINKVKYIKEILIPLMYDSNNKLLLKTLKSKNFLLWLNLVDIYYLGYHTILEGKQLFDIIKNNINKYSLTTNDSLKRGLKTLPEIKLLLSELYLLDSPYEIKNGVRYHRGTNNLVGESNQIISIDENNYRVVHNSMSEATNSLNISRKTIKECLTTGKSYKGITFIFK
uniref:homing endonuclease n=1 Tax=Leptographium wingfieldii TaxID=155675 RepID=UPI0023EFFD51